MCFESKEAAFAAVCRERDAYLSALKFNGTACVICAHIADEPTCSAECAVCFTKCVCHTCDKHCSNFEWSGNGVPYGQKEAGQS